MPHLFADIEHRRFVTLSFADYDAAADRQTIEFGAHGIDGSLIRRFLITPSAQACGSYGRALRNANKLKSKDAIQTR
ncbi:hypothetical protein GCM10010136_30850 [Limoniibacter endophyticus]|uniref:Uncharacterized protein n=1 Tax=Limoniibacter endophyticus TaxID=1565040 RepID=A0A8J3DR14_9HYPH|nr:hypothetical protein GCM10010136_30850 [Limoniibacter endophyticus]